MSRTDGVEEAKLASVNDYDTDPMYSTLERLCLRYADAMSQTPVEVPDELFAELTLQLDRSQIVELTATIAWENYRARFNHALGIGSDGFAEGAVCPMPSRVPAPLPRQSGAT